MAGESGGVKVIFPLIQIKVPSKKVIMNYYAWLRNLLQLITFNHPFGRPAMFQRCFHVTTTSKKVIMGAIQITMMISSNEIYTQHFNQAIVVICPPCKLNHLCRHWHWRSHQILHLHCQSHWFFHLLQPSWYGREGYGDVYLNLNQFSQLLAGTFE